MDLDKRKYKNSEVKEIISKISSDYEDSLFAQKVRISELLDENEKLKTENSALKEQENLIARTLKDAEVKSSEILNKAESDYALIYASLKSFVKKFGKYFGTVQKKYPLYGDAEKAKSVFESLEKKLLTEDARKAVKEIDGVIPSVSEDETAISSVSACAQSVRAGKIFNPKQKIDEYISATGSNGFDLDKVLNPGELDLEDLCKEMGLIEKE